LFNVFYDKTAELGFMNKSRQTLFLIIIFSTIPNVLKS